jgi:SAM-dependent methyltransferase
MVASVQNFLHRNPQHHDFVHYELDELTPRMCLRMFSLYLPKPPASILDVGCGTGRDLDFLSGICPDCWGVDHLPEVIESARTQRPHLHLRVGDMRSVRLGRAFDVIICMGSGFMYARSHEDVEKVLETFAAHAHTGTLLILDVLNAASFLGGTEVSLPRFSAATASVSSFDRRRQMLVRHRTWNIPGELPVEDCCRHRSFFPNEVRQLLTERGFRVVGMFDNMELRDTDLSGLKLYVGSIMRF